MSARRRRNSDSRNYDDWLDKAQQDFDAATILLKYSDDYEMVAFHCQQCIEKALKGYLIYKSGTAFDGHNLTYLCRQAMKHERGFSRWLEESATLNRYYIETRYPADIPLEITEEEIRRIYLMAEELFQFIEDELDKECA